MSMKKKLGSKLSEGVRQVKSQRESVPAIVLPQTMPVAEPVVQTLPTSPAVKPGSLLTKPVTPDTATQTKTNLNKLHPQRVWPD